MARTKAGLAVQTQMTRRGITQAKLGVALGKSQSWVSQGLLDDTARTIKRLWVNEPDTFASLLGLLQWDVESLERETGLALAQPTDEAVLVPARGTGTALVFDLLSAGPGSDGGTVIGEIDIPAEWRGEHIGYVVTGDSMSPLIPNGSTVVVKCQDHATPGNVIVAWAPEHGMLVKTLERLNGGMFMLTSRNPAFDPIWTRELRIYGVVREVRTPITVINGNHSR